MNKTILELVEFRLRQLLVIGLFIAVLLFLPESSSAAPTPVDEQQLVSDTVSPQQAARIARIFGRRIGKDQPGAVVCVTKNGKVIYARGFGLADVKTGQPLLPSSVFDLASCSKQFTAMAVLMLVERAKLSLDDEVFKYLPELGAKGHHLRVRNLLNMTSGLSDYSEEFAEDELREKSPTDVLHWTGEQPIKFQPGSLYEYNNGNYALLSLIVERVAGEHFSEFLMKNIFQPAGMDHTVVLTHPGQQVKDRVEGYCKESAIKWIPDEKSFKRDRLDTHIFGDGQVMTSAEDYARWDKALNDGILVKPETLNLAYTPTKLSNGTESGYGYGWGVGNDCGEKTVSHEGGWSGTSTYIVRYLKSHLTVIVLSNFDDFDSEECGNRVARFLHKGKSPASKASE